MESHYICNLISGSSNPSTKDEVTLPESLHYHQWVRPAGCDAHAIKNQSQVTGNVMSILCLLLMRDKCNLTLFVAHHILHQLKKKLISLYCIPINHWPWWWSICAINSVVVSPVQCRFREVCPVPLNYVNHLYRMLCLCWRLFLSCNTARENWSSLNWTGQSETPTGSPEK